jgi:AraC-like DNA-binding protein
MQLDKPCFMELLQLCGSAVKSKVDNHHFTVNSTFGKGYGWAEQLPSGITLMVSDTALAEDLKVERSDMESHYFILQFNEEFADDSDGNIRSKRNQEDFQSFVKLSHTLVPETFIFPSNKRLRSVKFLFTRDHLSSLLGKPVVEELISQFFPVVMKSDKLEPIATEYRVMLDDLWSEKITEPLRLNYIQNRILLLLEKYILKLYERRDLSGKKVKRSDDETLRLMKVEALLVKNFSVSPPTIDDLSRISAMSPTKLKNDFKQLYGLPIYEYYQKNRMLKAKSLLVLGKYTIKEVGIMVGYSNLSHFANTFKKEFGFLPSEIEAKDGVLIYSK